jgi:hypothetical protein
MEEEPGLLKWKIKAFVIFALSAVNPTNASGLKARQVKARVEASFASAGPGIFGS